MALDFTTAFGKDATLTRTADPRNPFKVVSEGEPYSTPMKGEPNTWANLGEEGREEGRVLFDADGNGHTMMENGEMGPLMMDPNPSGVSWLYDERSGTYTNPVTGKSVSTSNLQGLSGMSPSQAKYAIAGAATLAGQNGDHWSDYALKHQSYAPTDNQQFWQGAVDLSKSFGDITGYEAKKGFGQKLIDAMVDYGPQLVLAAATAGASGAFDLGAAGVAAEQAAAPVVDAVVTPVMTGATETTGGLSSLGAATEGAGGYFSGIGGASTAVPEIGIGNALGATATPEIGIGAAAGSSAAPSLFTAGELASMFPTAYATTALANGSNYAPVVDAVTKTIANKPVSDLQWKLASLVGDDTAGFLTKAGSTILNNPGAVTALVNAVAGDKGKGGQQVSGSANRPAWMNQGLPAIQPRQMRSNKIVGNPLQYGMGPQQKLYTDERGEVYQPKNFGQVGGLQYGIPITKAKGGGVDSGCGCGGLEAIGYVGGGSPGQADEVPAQLSHGEYVFDADIVAALGDGNNEAGARILDKFRENIRKHKRAASANSIPPKAKSISAYLKGTKK